ncbi:FCD domain-containing protein, partial [Acinetobacter baumannii]
RKFHQALAESADNATLIDLLHVMRSLLHVYANRAVHDDDSVATAIEEHAAVLAAVARGDENGAAAAMADHMATATHRLKAEITR